MHVDDFGQPVGRPVPEWRGRPPVRPVHLAGDYIRLEPRAAAARLGFSYEGRFRNASVYKGRNRDTDWFSITDEEWPALSGAYAAWLSADNFDAGGRQRIRLRDLTARALGRS